MTKTESGASPGLPILSVAEANVSRLAVFRKNADVLLGVRQLSTFDCHASLICIAYSNCEWDFDGNPLNGTTLPFNGGPPHHFNCRSVLVGISGNPLIRNMKGTRASDEGQIDRNTSFDQFFKRKPRSYLDEILGEGRADLWCRGKISCRDLLDDGGHIMSLEELRFRFDD
ncbi:MAG: hypothetical protein V4559_08890 [Pseudomonadota bacterium]